MLFPFDVGEAFGSRGKIPIRATFDGVAYTGSLVKYGNPLHMLPLLKAIREKIGKGPGDLVEVELWKDDKQRTVEVPVALVSAMESAGVLEFFNTLSYTHRKEYCLWVSEAKKEETRSKRLIKTVEMLQERIRTLEAKKIR